MVAYGGVMEEMLRESGLLKDLYPLDHVKKFSSSILQIYSSAELTRATMEAKQEQEDTNDTGRVHVLIPCNDSVDPKNVEECLSGAKKSKFKAGKKTQKFGIYGRTADAYNGRTIDGEPHASFFVYDTNAAIIVDLISRENGESLLSPSFRQNYLLCLATELDYTVGWQQRPLCDERNLEELVTQG